MRQSRRRTIWFRCSYGINRLVYTHTRQRQQQTKSQTNNTTVHTCNNACSQFNSISYAEVGNEVLFVCACGTPFSDNGLFLYFICKVRWSKSTMNDQISVIYFISIFIFFVVFVSFTCFLFVNNQLKALCATRYRKRSYYIF